MARKADSYRAPRREAARHAYRCYPRTLRCVVGNHLIRGFSGIRKQRSVGALAVAEAPVEVTAWERMEADQADRLATLCMERDSLPQEHPRRRTLDAEAFDIARRLEWRDQFASSPADLSSYVA
jgi:hypothetical protein